MCSQLIGCESSLEFEHDAAWSWSFLFPCIGHAAGVPESLCKSSAPALMACVCGVVHSGKDDNQEVRVKMVRATMADDEASRCRACDGLVRACDRPLARVRGKLTTTAADTIIAMRPACG